MPENEAQVAENEGTVDGAVNQEATEQNDDTAASNDTSSINDLQDALKEIQKLRKENAAKRVKSKETEEAAQKWKEHLDSQKSELEKLQETAEQLKAENAAMKLEQKRAALAKEHGLDPDLAEFITGSTDDEMTEKAKKLAEKYPAKHQSTPADLHAGNRGSDLGGQQSTGGKYLQSLFDQ